MAHPHPHATSIRIPTGRAPGNRKMPDAFVGIARHCARPVHCPSNARFLNMAINRVKIGWEDGMPRRHGRMRDANIVAQFLLFTDFEQCCRKAGTGRARGGRAAGAGQARGSCAAVAGAGACRAVNEKNSTADARQMYTILDARRAQGLQKCIRSLAPSQELHDSTRSTCGGWGIRGHHPRPTPATPRPTPGAPRPNPDAPWPTPGTPWPTPATPLPTPGAPRPTPATPRPTPGAPRPTPGAHRQPPLLHSQIGSTISRAREQDIAPREQDMNAFFPPEEK
eukprot:gene15432-biopygen20185